AHAHRLNLVGRDRRQGHAENDNGKQRKPTALHSGDSWWCVGHAEIVGWAQSRVRDHLSPELKRLKLRPTSLSSPPRPPTHRGVVAGESDHPAFRPRRPRVGGELILHY